MLVKDLLRKYPQWSHDCIAVVGSISSKNIQEPKAKAALIWMLGEYSQDMQDAPYILESLVENWDDEPSAEVTSPLPPFPKKKKKLCLNKLRVLLVCSKSVIRHALYVVLKGFI